MSLSAEAFSKYNFFSVQLAPEAELYHIPVSQTWKGRVVFLKSTESEPKFDCRIEVHFSGEEPRGAFTFKEKGSSDDDMYVGLLKGFEIVVPGKVKCSSIGSRYLRYDYFSIQQNG